MAKDDTGAARSMKRKQYLPHNPVKKKGSYPLRPGVEGFFITCDGGRVFSRGHQRHRFHSSGSEDDDDGNVDEVDEETNVNSENNDNALDEKSESETSHEEKREQLDAEGVEEKSNGASEPPFKRQCTENDSSKCSIPEIKVNKSIDKLIEDEIRELGDKSMVKLNALMLERHFASLDSGCNGVIFIQMRRKAGDPGPKKIVQHIMTSAASTRKQMSRFILRILPVELACYASEEEISKTIEPLVSQHFPAETESPLKFAVFYDAGANTGIDRMKIINSVAKSIPEPHKVDLNSPTRVLWSKLSR